MTLQSDAAKAYIEKLLETVYPYQMSETFGQKPISWEREYRFMKPRLWRFDYAVPVILCANLWSFLRKFIIPTPIVPESIIEIDGGTFQFTRTGHSSGVGLKRWREKNNAAMSLGWRIFHYAPEEIIKAGRKGTGIIEIFNEANISI